MEKLNSIINGKDSELEDTQEEVKDYFSRLKEENKMLMKDNRQLTLKVTELQTLLDTSRSKGPSR